MIWSQNFSAIFWILGLNFAFNWDSYYFRIEETKIFNKFISLILKLSKYTKIYIII